MSHRKLGVCALLAAAPMIGGGLGVGAPRAEASVPGAAFQRVLDGLVTGPGLVAPGAAAYVLAPQGTWAGAAGTANVKTRQAMWPNARMRIQSNSKA